MVVARRQTPTPLSSDARVEARAEALVDLDFEVPTGEHAAVPTLANRLS